MYDHEKIHEYIKIKLAQLAKLFPTAAVVDQARRLVVIKNYLDLLQQYRGNPRVKKKAERASEVACRNSGKNTPSFRRKIQSEARFLIKNGFIPPYRQGNSSNHASLLDNEAVLLKIRLYLARLPVGGITPRKFRAHLTDKILPSVVPLTLKAVQRIPRASVSIRTAVRWLRRLGYSRHPVKKGLYVDGHECPDVKEARDAFLKEMEGLQK